MKGNENFKGLIWIWIMTFQKLSSINHVTNAEELIVLRKFPDHFTDFLRKKEGWLGATRFKLIKCPFLYFGVFELFGRWSEYPPPLQCTHFQKRHYVFRFRKFVFLQVYLKLLVKPMNKLWRTSYSYGHP